jgi:transposase-like protein
MVLMVIIITAALFVWAEQPMRCPKCGSSNTYYDAGGTAGIYSIDESFHCYDCGNRELN